MKVIVSNIQRFCLHDGPGIRTTVFFKGCNLRCPWCSNPENIEYNIQKYVENDEIHQYGFEISLENLEKELLKDRIYYENGGGVTFSGGDGLLQFKKIKPLLINLKKKKINLCAETSLIVPTDIIDIAIKYLDEFIVDIKILDEQNVYKINGNVNLFKNNIEKIFSNNCNVIFRIPLVPQYTVSERNMEEIINLLKKYKPKMVQIFKIHRLGEKKYKLLNKEMPKFLEISNNQIEEIKLQIEKLGIKVQYCKV